MSFINSNSYNHISTFLISSNSALTQPSNPAHWLIVKLDTSGYPIVISVSIISIFLIVY